jgi:hypothetical protein
MGLGVIDIDGILFSEITLSPTYIYMVRYSDVQLLLEEGRVELI